MTALYARASKFNERASPSWMVSGERSKIRRKRENDTNKYSRLAVGAWRATDDRRSENYLTFVLSEDTRCTRFKLRARCQIKYKCIRSMRWLGSGLMHACSSRTVFVRPSRTIPVQSPSIPALQESCNISEDAGQKYSLSFIFHPRLQPLQKNVVTVVRKNEEGYRRGRGRLIRQVASEVMRSI